MLDVPTESVPEPSVLMLVGVGLVGLVRSRRQKMCVA
ncbi:PEP-CTERM sorting domain-containing protein [Undibacterium sp. Xuan67W]